LPEVAYDYVSRVRVKVAANPAATKTQQPTQVGRIKTTQKHNANRTSYFINSIDQQPTFAIAQRKIAALQRIATFDGERERRS